MIERNFKDFVVDKLIIKVIKFNKKIEVVFTLFEDYLIINYFGMCLKIDRNNIYKIKLIEFEGINRIFMNIDNGIKLEYIFEGDLNDINKIKNFFKVFDFKKNKKTLKFDI